MTQAAAQPDPLIAPRQVRDALMRAIEAGRLHRPRAYQADRLQSTSRFNLDNWSRQIGKSDFAAACDGTLLAAETGVGVMNLSASLDQTKELMLKYAIYAETLHGVAGEIQREVQRGAMDETLYVDDHGLRITQTVIALPGGIRIVGRPANPRTARGFSMHVKLDEFAMHQDQDEIWAAAFPTITSRSDLRLDVLSTPGMRTDDRFADLVQAAERGESDFAYRKVTIHDAVRDGLNADPDHIRRNLRDEDRFRREYLCEFVDEAGAFLAYELIRACQHEAIRCALPSDPKSWEEATLGWNPQDGSLYLGVDIGRRRDMTALWLIQMVGDVAWTRALIVLDRMPFTEQQAWVDRILEHLPVQRCCIDETGVGMMLAEQVQARFGTGRVEGVTFTNAVKAELAEALRPRFQDRLIRVPVDQTVAEDLHSVRKTATAAGNVRYLGERTEDGHADRFWALALAVHATETGTIPRMSRL